jgi:hypothetical protein
VRVATAGGIHQDPAADFAPIPVPCSGLVARLLKGEGLSTMLLTAASSGQSSLSGETISELRNCTPLLPVMASGSFNSLPRVLCTLQSLYLCSIGPMSILRLGRDSAPFFKLRGNATLLSECRDLGAELGSRADKRGLSPRKVSCSKLLCPHRLNQPLPYQSQLPNPTTRSRQAVSYLRFWDGL